MIFPQIPGVEFFDATAAQALFGIDTGGARREFSGAAKVTCREAVAPLVAYARDKRIALWPISGGRNFGYGTALSVHDGCLVVDLSSLKEIVYNGDSQTFTIEPGVTQKDLDDFLQKHSLPYLVPTTGIGPNGNLLGNALDGGYGLTPITDHFEAFSRLEGVWGNGQTFGHNFDSLGCPDMANRWPAGLGPSVHGLLRQGCFGIVTRGTLRLMRAPEACAVLVLEWKTSERFFASQDALSELTEELPLLGGIISMNGPRILSTMADAPLTSPLRGAERLAYFDKLCAQREVAAWTAVGTLYGPKATVRAAIRDLRRRLPLARVWSFTPNQIRTLSKLAALAPVSWFAAKRRHLGALVNTTGTVEGRPITAFMRIAYALESTTPVMDVSRHPAKDGQGILWFAPLVPLTSAGVKAYSDKMAQVLLKHGFDPLLAVTTRTSRVHSGTIPLLFKKTPEDIARAKRCYTEMVQVGLTMGMPPYRIGVDYMHLTWPRDEQHEMWQTLQQALDPSGIIAPGRYLPPKV